MHVAEIQGKHKRTSVSTSGSDRPRHYFYVHRMCILGSENDNLLPHIHITNTVSITYFSERYQSQINIVKVLLEKLAKVYKALSLPLKRIWRWYTTAIAAFCFMNKKYSIKYSIPSEVNQQQGLDNKTYFLEPTQLPVM